MSRITRLPALLAVVLIALAGPTACTLGSDKDEPGAKKSSQPTRFTAPSAKPATTLGAAEGALNLVAPAGFVESGRSDPRIDWVTAFTKATGCKIKVTVSADADQTARLMKTGKYDGVAAPGDVSLRLIADKSVAPVNPALIPGAAKIVAGLRNQPFNSVDKVSYGVPQGRSATLLVWRTDQVKPAPTTWNVLYSGGSAYKGRITTFESPMTIADAAHFLKTSRPELRITDPYALTKQQLDAAVALLRVQRGLISGYWRTFQQVVPAFKEGRVVVGATTQAIAALAAAEGAKVSWRVPADGTTGSSTTWMLAAKAAHPTCMYKWMDHVLTPKVNAQAAEWLGTAPSVPGACGYTVDRSWCYRFRVSDEKFWSTVAMWHTPLSDCRDARGTTCTDYATWVEAWRTAVR